MEDLNLHFTGDLHAIGVANNLLATIPRRTSCTEPDRHRSTERHLRRCMDMNDRALRDIVVGSAPSERYVRQSGSTSPQHRSDGSSPSRATWPTALTAGRNHVAQSYERAGDG